KNEQIKTLELSKQIATYGILLGVIVFFTSLFVSDFNPNYTMSVSGIGIVIASMVFFGFGMFLCLADEISTKHERIKI
ncbi:MAG: hypothetical protein Q8906_13085, partial [Bacillota bacterium]|nr:hypothetical protein [Bacillota bacterium]